MKTEDQPQLKRRLAHWFKQHARDLPWRRQRTAYTALVSELMLQQTQVSTVLPYFERWMKRFPSFEALASASEEAVLKHWEGLGYYRRARYLQAAARQIVENRCPNSYESWLKICGVGSYTAAAITSMVDGQPHAVVDGNVVRVLARLSGESRLFPDKASSVKFFQPLAEQFLDRDQPGVHNEAMMELGATLCRPASADCGSCPLANGCASAHREERLSIPAFQASKRQKRRIDRALVVRERKLLLSEANQGGERLKGLLEIPLYEEVSSKKPGRRKPLFTGKRAIGQEDIEERVFRCEEPSETEARWVAIEELEQITLSGPHRRWLTQLLEQDLL